MYVCTSTLGGKGVAEVCVHVYKCMALCAMCVCPLSTSNMHHINLYKATLKLMTSHPQLYVSMGKYDNP